MSDTMIDKIRSLASREKALARELIDVRAKLKKIRMALGEMAEDRIDGRYGERYVSVSELIQSALKTHGPLRNWRLLRLLNEVRPISRAYMHVCLTRMMTDGTLTRVRHGVYKLADVETEQSVDNASVAVLSSTVSPQDS